MAGLNFGLIQYSLSIHVRDRQLWGIVVQFGGELPPNFEAFLCKLYFFVQKTSCVRVETMSASGQLRTLGDHFGLSAKG